MASHHRVTHLSIAAAALLVGVPLLSGVAIAQSQGEGRSGQAAADAAPTLTLTGNVRGVRSDATTSRALSLSRLDVVVNVRGGVAETEMTATFQNDSNDVLEGDFAFVMPAGSVVTGYALDINGTMIDGVLAGRDQAREAYQRRVVQRIDPGLAEVDTADRFSTRVFPIRARGSRTIRLRMASPVDPRTGFALPMQPAGRVGQLSIRVSGEGAAAARLPAARGLAWRSDAGGQSAGGQSAGGQSTAGQLAEAQGVALSGVLAIPAAVPAGTLLVSRHANGQAFFTLDDVLPRFAGAATGAAPVHILFDRSASRLDSDMAAEAALIDAALADAGNPPVTLVMFDSDDATIHAGLDRAGVARMLAAVELGGGTSFGHLARALDAAGMPAGATCLLVTDGLNSIDARQDVTLPCRTHVIASGRNLDRGWLQNIAATSGGAYVEVGAMTRGAALAALRSGAGDLGRVTDGAGNAIPILRLPAGEGRYRIVGPMPEDGTVALREGDRVMRSYTPAGVAAGASGPGALWAARRLAVQANDLPTAQLVDFARRYSVASPLASFIVLEAPADYVEANIPPPESYPKPLRDQWEAMAAQQRTALDAQQAQRLTQVTGAWQGVVGWWGRDWSQAAPDQDEQQRDRQSTSERVGPPRLTPPPPLGAPPPPPPPPPPSPPPPPQASVAPVVEAAEGDAAQIIVSGSRSASGEVAAEAAAVTDAEPGAAAGPVGTIEVPEFDSNRPWIVALDGAGSGWPAALQRLLREHGRLPIFWLDVAEWHHRAGRTVEARRAAMAALEAPSRDNQTLSIVAARLQRYGALDRAIWLLDRLVDREIERPQPLRTLAMALMDRALLHERAGRRDAASADLRRAITLLADAVLKVRRESYQGFEQTALMEANLAVARYRALGGQDHDLPAGLVRLLDTDIRIVMEWNTPRTDLDLWITQPDGQRVGYSSRLSSNGGRLTADVTNGFGPEEFMLRRAMPGRYTIEANVFAGDRANPNGPSRLAVRIIRNFGRADQAEELLDIEMLPERQGMQPLGSITIAPSNAPTAPRGARPRQR